MPKLIDLTGQRFGYLTVIKRHEENTGSNHPRWECQCDCGNICIVAGSNLKRGTKSCGCARSKRVQGIDETGNKYGRLTVLNRVKSKNNKATWLCQCECGNTVEVKGQDLRLGRVITCGHCNDNYHKIDEIGNKYGSLTVIECMGPDKFGNITWKCKCDCGSIIVTTGKSLRAGTTQSCGCLKSKGEKLISELLNTYGLPYEKEKTFPNCRFKDTNATPRFDFYVDNKYLIEFDGEQHYGKGTWGQDYENIHKRDMYKNQWCQENSIPLIRIPYTHFKDLCIDDLRLETSLFVYQGGELG